MLTAVLRQALHQLRARAAAGGALRETTRRGAQRTQQVSTTTSSSSASSASGSGGGSAAEVATRGRAARRAAREKMQETPTKTEAAAQQKQQQVAVAQKRTPTAAMSRGTVYWAGALAAGVGATWAAWHWWDDPQMQQVRRQMNDWWVRVGGHSMFGAWLSVHDPVEDELLPSWKEQLVMMGIPADKALQYGPPPPTLVVGFEDVVVAVENSYKYGSRFAWRPGARQFFKDMAPYYEIVLFLSSPQGEEHQVALNPEMLMGLGISHLKDRSYMSYVDGKNIKDLNRLGRPITGVVTIEADEDITKLNSRNAIHVAKYTNGRDRTDTTLTDLVPFLIELGKKLREGTIPDVRPVLDELSNDGGVHSASDVLAGYEARRVDFEMQEAERKGRGLGGFVRRSRAAAEGVANSARARMSALIPGSSAHSAMVAGSSSAAMSMTSSGTATDRPRVTKRSTDRKKGSLWQSVEDSNQQAMERRQRKNERMNELYMERMKQKEEERQRQQQEEEHVL